MVDALAVMGDGQVLADSHSLKQTDRSINLDVPAATSAMHTRRQRKPPWLKEYAHRCMVCSRCQALRLSR